MYREAYRAKYFALTAGLVLSYRVGVNGASETKFGAARGLHLP
jgi:hypothetical protein